jgi:hypothetical protein
MARKAHTTKAQSALTRSVQAAALMTALGTTLTACTGAARTAAASNQSAAPNAGAAAGGSAGGSATAGGSGTATSGGAAGTAGAAGNIPAAARTPICQSPGARLRIVLPGSGQPIPPGFTAIAIVRCTFAGAIRPTKLGGFTRQEVAVTGLGPVLAALRLPSAARNQAMSCLPPTLFLTRIALIGSNGSVIYPRIPVNACGIPLLQLTTRLDALHWIPVGSTTEPQGLPSQNAAGQGAIVSNGIAWPAS